MIFIKEFVLFLSSQWHPSLEVKDYVFFTVKPQLLHQLLGHRILCSKCLLNKQMNAVLCLVAQLCLTFCDPMDSSLPGSSVHGDSPGKNTGVGCHALLQGIFPTQGWNPGFPQCRWILYHLTHQGSPWVLEWVAYPFSRGSSGPRNWTGVSCIAGRFFTSWATREAFQFFVFLCL